ncbi:M23 family metallopeptidase [Nocardia aurantiaca]|uniref:Peptidoglycan DD-metalloendopeptidase family protein n=1 Tax=Nocardia aurantiaca TaxID=2675850 RepID=A0A6I3KQ40_9NOCA|nr:M23 family metallopeptidase [Nocardia aurantiaca]MTE11441.1 peptidoglycan DD-metalloendopeptidase family protein [Nocardia aurantiaca]
MDLLGDSGVVRTGATSRRRHRAEPSAAERVKTAAGAAVAAGALIGTASQLVPALAYAAPLLPTHDEKPATIGEDVAPVEQTALELKQAKQDVAPAAEIPQAQPVAATTPDPAPFGLQNLPPEISGPLSQAEQTLKTLQQHLNPGPAVVKPVDGQLTSGYGVRWGAMHYGIDFADPIGTPIHSVMGGTVIDAGPASGFGLWVRVKQDDGTTAVYGHVNDMYVSVGQRVNTGDVIASVGNRGNSTGPHLHLEIWDAADNKMDPLPWLASKGVLMQQQWGPDQ